MAPRLDLAGYLRRLDLAEDPGPPSPEGLRALHAAHVERIPYEGIEIQLGRPTTIDPHDSAERIVARHRGGYCYHLNGAFSLLLANLGYDVTWHRAGVQGHSEPDPVGAVGNHLALTVENLPEDSCPHGVWLVDAGLGDALHEPLPLATGRYRQGPFVYELRPSTVERGGWRFEHDPAGSFVGMDFRPARATTDDFEERHRFLSGSPDSQFVRTCSVQRRDADGVDKLTGCVLGRVGHGEHTRRTLDTATDWFEALGDVFDLPLTDLTESERQALWARVRNAHEAWLAAQYSR
jgi:N-hydroxyarylamine O-acetyltransferase